MLIIPYRELESDTLQNLIEEFVTRDGTDYGVNEKTMAEKSAAIMKALHAKHAVIVFDESSQSCQILSTDELAALSAQLGEGVHDE